MSAFSLRLDPELKMWLTQGAVRRKTTKTCLVQELLRQALEPKNPVALLYAARAHYGLPDPQLGPVTERSQNTKQLAYRRPA